LPISVRKAGRHCGRAAPSAQHHNANVLSRKSGPNIAIDAPCGSWTHKGGLAALSPVADQASGLAIGGGLSLDHGITRAALASGAVPTGAAAVQDSSAS
jgi:hypothetical protein